MKLCVKNACHLGAKVDLFVSNGKVVNMVPSGKMDISEEFEVFDAKGLLLFPSFIDAHVHLREPGYEYKEDINSGLNAALHGGYGAVMCMANTNPCNDSASVTSLMIEKAKKSHPHGPKLYPIAAASIGLKGEVMAPLSELKDAGCIAVSNDGRPVHNTELLRHIMEYAADLNMIFIDHCEDADFAKGWLMNEGDVSGFLGVKGQPAMGEAIQAMRDIMLAEYLNIPVHIAHVSSKLTIDVIKFGKDRGVKVSAETCPHYLILTDSAVDGYNTLAKVSPPLRTEEDRDALLEAVKSGLIDILVTDHAPHAAHEKETTLDLAPFGFTGLDLALSLVWKLVNEKKLKEADIHRLMSKRPAEIFNLPYNNFDPNDPADFFLFDPKEKWEVKPENLYSKSHNTPFLGQTLCGRVKHHFLAGKKLC